jgi:hypothetical protein
MRGDAMRQLQISSKPAFFGSAEGFNILPFLSPANGCTKYNGDDIDELMAFVVFPRIPYLAKMLENVL